MKTAISILLFSLVFVSSVEIPISYIYAMFNSSHTHREIKNLSDYTNVFKIHGLWPEYLLTNTTCDSCINLNTTFTENTCNECIKCVGKDWPQWCDNTVNFDINLLKNNETLWNQITSLYEENVDSLLEHEYLKHGTCTNYDEVTYFSIIIDLYYKIYNLQMKKGKFCLECFCLNSSLDIIII